MRFRRTTTALLASAALLTANVGVSEAVTPWEGPSAQTQTLTPASTPKALSRHQRHLAHLRHLRVLAAREAARRARASELGRALAWSHSSDGMRVKECESSNRYGPEARTGIYQGAWQMDPSFWRSYGGRAFASHPDAARPWQQDLVAYRGYRARGWEPWVCARIVGII